MKICSYDVDFTRQATSASLCRYFLDAAWNHAEALGVGYTHLQRQGKLWVLSRLLVEFQRYPTWGSVATLRTWPRPAKSAFAMRSFEFTDDTGSRFAAGSSAWLVLGTASKWPLRANKLLPGLADLPDQPALNRDPEKLEVGERWTESYSATVRYSDIDVNCHVTSSRYVGWMLDAYPLKFHLTHGLRTLEINYVGETLEGDVLDVRTRQTGPTVFCHSLTKAGDVEVCRARLEWAERPAATPPNPRLSALAGPRCRAGQRRRAEQ